MSIDALLRKKNEVMIELHEAKALQDRPRVKSLAEQAAQLEGKLAEQHEKNGRREDAAINLFSQANCFLDCDDKDQAAVALRRAKALTKTDALRARIDEILARVDPPVPEPALVSPEHGGGGRRLRLIDLIPEHEDRVDAPTEWNWLMEPFRLAFSLSPTVVARDAYVDVPASKWETHHLASLGATPLRLESEGEGLRLNQALLRQNGTPALLIGEPGVGKTTWLTRFFSEPHVKQEFYSYRFDASAGYPALGPVDLLSYVQLSLGSGIVGAMRTESERLGLDTPACQIDLDYAEVLTVQRVVQESAATLHRHDHVGWVILDNLDRQNRPLQRAAMRWARNLSTLGLRTLIAVRPYTLCVVDRMYEMHRVTLPPPSLSRVLQERSEYALRSALAKELLAQLRSGISATLSWTREKIRDERSLQDLWRRVADTIGDLPALHKHLFAVHLGDMHEIMEDLRQLMASGYFCQEIMRRLATGARRSQHEFLTAYVRGNYHHHRQSELSGAGMVNIYAVPGSNRKHRLLVIRFLQFLRTLTAGGSPMRFGELRGELKAFAYEPRWIDVVARLLVHKRLVLEVTRFVDWHNPDLTLEDDDKLELSQSGTYYLDVLTATPRYIEAMADVTYLDEAVAKRMPVDCHTADEGFRKGLLFMTEVSRDVRAEHTRLEKAGLLRRFYQRTDVGQGFFYAGVQASLGHARRLHKKGKLRPAIVESWESLFKVACEFREKRAAMSSGD